MSDKTGIEWTDATWNPITGCSVVSPGCTNCYAMRLAGTRLKHHPTREGLTVASKAGPVWNGQVRFNERALLDPLRWSRPRRIFVCAHGDIFAEGVPDEWIDRVFAVMALCPQHTFQVLTKRPGRMRAYFAETWQVPARAATRVLDIDIPAQPARVEDRWSQVNRAIDNLTMSDVFDADRFWTADDALIGRPAWPRSPLPNVWLGTSVEDQRRADERIPELLATPAAVRFISVEPLLGPLRLHESLGDDWLATGLSGEHRGLDWVIVGGESGPGARPMHPDWARSLRDQCAAARVPFFFKQWGSFSLHEIEPDGHLRPPLPMNRSLLALRRWDGASFRRSAADESAHSFLSPGVIAAPVAHKAAAGRLLDGVEHNAMPEAAR